MKFDITVYCYFLTVLSMVPMWQPQKFMR